MKVKCEYCGNFIEDTQEKCPDCGGANSFLRRTVDETPKTIDDLKAWCDARGLTAEKTRFFVGTNYTQPKAFGIYQNEKGEFVVYKNKANGERAIRYQGKDEAYAVNELWMRLREEALNQKAHTVSRSSTGSRSSSGGSPSSGSRSSSGSDNNGITFVLSLIVFITFVIMALSALASSSSSRATPNIRPSFYYYIDWNSGGGYTSSYSSYSSYYDYDYSDYSSWDSSWDSYDSYDSWDSDYSDWDSDW